jgi:hypothetical protein
MTGKPSLNEGLAMLRQEPGAADEWIAERDDGEGFRLRGSAELITGAFRLVSDKGELFDRDPRPARVRHRHNGEIWERRDGRWNQIVPPRRPRLERMFSDRPPLRPRVDIDGPA